MFRVFKKYYRCYKIISILNRYNIQEFAKGIPKLRLLRVLSFINMYKLFVCKNKTKATRLRLALESLGPIFIKFGQALSTRKDLFSEDIIDELSKLQDNVPPFSNESAHEIIRKNINRSLNDIFLDIESNPIASASISQVYRATLKDESKVVIKVQRPDIKKKINLDLDLLTTIAKVLEKYLPVNKKIKTCGGG